MTSLKERFYRYWLIAYAKQSDALSTVSRAKDFIIYFLDDLCPSDTVLQSWLDDFKNSRK